MPYLSMNVNGANVAQVVESRTLLVSFLRDTLRLTGTHIGCDTSQCGACVVHVDGVSVKSCTQLALQCNGCSVITIEGIGSSTEMHPMQAAFHSEHGLQCGYCTPGMIMSAIDLINRCKTMPTEDTIRSELDGNLCRCTGYHNIVRAILKGGGFMLDSHRDVLEDR